MRWIRAALVAAAALPLPAAFAAVPPDLDDYVARAMAATHAPAISIAIVENGTATLAKGYGVRRLGEAARADEHTLFPIGSNTKQFTATALAMLVDAGKLGWDDKVVARLPGFQMYDSYATGEMTVRDLLVHRSGLGLGEGDLMLFPRTNRSRQEVVEALRYLKPARSFRGGYAYDNVLYVVAGRLLENVAAQSWESFIRDRLFKPLGMKDAMASYEGLAAPRTNFAWPHVRQGGPNWAIGGEVVALDAIMPVENVAAPAGAILASAQDLTKWLNAQLAHGAIAGDKRLFSEAANAALWNPETLIPTQTPPPGPLAVTAPQFHSYALGYDVRDYRGHKIVSHGGGWIGGISTIVMIPDLNVGFAVMTNSMEVAALHAIELHLLDHYLGLPATDWVPPLQTMLTDKADKAAAYLKTLPSDAAEGPPPSLPLEKYAGVYRDPWYGTVTIKPDGKSLAISFDRSPGFSGALEHVRHDTFRTRWTNRVLEDAYVTFSIKPDETIERIAMKAISPLADFSFDYQDLALTPQAK
jgi:CubicO group peptidase (beta-lactamase class C family)